MDETSCCCNSVRITLGAKILSVLIIVGGVFGILSGVSSTIYPTSYRTGIIITSVVQILAALLVFSAINRHKANLMKPMIAFIGISIVIYTIYFILALLAAIWPGTPLGAYIKDVAKQMPEVMKPILDSGVTMDQFVAMVGCYLAVVFAVSIGFCVWFFKIYLDTYKFIASDDRHSRPIFGGKA